LRVGSDFSLGNRNSETLQQFFGLILVDVHATRMENS
jgi:hypothetical protein